MARKLEIESRILQLNGGQYQALCSEYFCKKRNLNNIVDLGQKTGSYKTTKGISDTYSEVDDGKFILVAYGTVEKNSIQKIKKDIRDCLNEKKTGIKKDDIKEIVIFHTCTNINPGAKRSIENSINGVKITLCDIDTLSYDLSNNYQSIANDYLNIPIDTNQISDIETFVTRYDNLYSNCPLNINYLEKKCRADLIKCVNENFITLVTGKPGTGKTKNVLEVCRYFDNLKAYRVICIKLNGHPIYDDLKFELEKNQKILIFIDDINYMPNLSTIVDYIKSNNTNVKVIATIRDYHLETVKIEIEKYVKPFIYVINNMSDDDIKKILEESYGVTNHNWQQKIIDIANGNPRIAIMTFNALKQDSNISCIADVFRKYYDNIINSRQLNPNEIDLLFYISVLSPFSIKDKKIMALLSAKNPNILEIILKLNDYELINYYNDEAIKICDQNLSNYIVYKYLFVDKKIKLSDFINKLYPDYKLKLINSINMLAEVFYSKELYEYLSSEINIVWTESNYTKDFDFLVAFHTMNLTRSSVIVKSIIEKQDPKYIPSYIKYNSNPYVCDKLLYIINNLSDWNFDIAVQLMFKYLEKSANLYNDIISIIKEKWMFKYPVINFENEKYLIDYLINKYNENSIYEKIYKLILKIILEASFEIEINRSFVEKANRLRFMDYTLENNDGLNDFRKFVFDKIITLSKKDDEFSNILLAKHIWYVKKDNLDIFKNDINYLDNELFNNIKKLNINHCIIIYNIRYYCIKYNINLPQNMKKFSLCDEFILLDAFYGYKYTTKNEKLINYINKLDVEDYNNLFSSLKNIEDKKNVDNYEFYSSINEMFNYLIANKNDMFLDVFELYLKNGTPFLQQFYYVLKYDNQEELIDKISISNAKYKYKILALLLENNVKSEYINYIRNFLYNQNDALEKYTLNIGAILKYTKFDINLFDSYAQQIFLANDESLVWQYFTCVDKELCKVIYDSFKDKEMLEKLYIIALKGNYMDLGGTLGFLLVKNNPGFIIDIEKNFNVNSGIISIIMENVWNDEDYINLVTDIFNNIKLVQMSDLIIPYVITKNNNIKSNDKRFNWYKNYIKNNIDDFDKIEWIFHAIRFEDDENKLVFISYFLDLNSDVNVFKKLSFFPIYYSYWGSGIPIYEKKLEFLYKVAKLIEERASIDYLEHLECVYSKINSLKSLIKHLKTEEFLNDFKN